MLHRQMGFHCVAALMRNIISNASPLTLTACERRKDTKMDGQLLIKQIKNTFRKRIKAFLKLPFMHAWVARLAKVSFKFQSCKFKVGRPKVVQCDH